MTKQQTQNVVPFGKYKGQPVEVLAQDRPYLEWLSAQDWFRERYAGIYTLIVNNFTEASETPDHNALQVLFLDDSFCERFATVLRPKWRTQCFEKVTSDLRYEIGELGKQLEKYRQRIEAYTIKEKPADYTDWRIEQINRDRAEAIEQAEKIEHRIEQCKSFEWKLLFWREFEVGGVDVKLNGSIRAVDKDLCHSLGATVVSTRIEIKPTVGDDYPAVLRQMRANNSEILFTNNYTGVGATADQFIKTFATSDKRVVFRRDVDAVQITDKPSGRIVL